MFCKALMIQDKQGNPITLNQYRDLLIHPCYKCVIQENVGDIYVSTVWLGLSYGGCFFETMMFKDGLHEIKKRCYKTIGEAREGHKEIVMELEGGKNGVKW
jgi:hypothetical protein